MINQLNEEYEDGKRYLPESRFLLHWFDYIRRQPLPRTFLRRIVVGGVKAPPPRRSVRFYEHGMVHTARTALAQPVQPRHDQAWTDKRFPHARSPIRKINETG